MDTAESLSRAITVTRELHSVVKTMKALAGVNIRQYEQAAHAVADFSRTIEMGLQIALQRIPAQQLPPVHAAGHKLGAVIFGSDQGMCGPLNDQVVSHAAQVLRRMAVRREDQTTVAVGVRAAAQLESLGASPDSIVGVPGSIAGITPVVEEVLRKVEEWHSRRGIEMVVLFNARPVSGAWYRIRGVRLLPVDREWINGLKAKHWPGPAIPTFMMDEAQLFQDLIREYLFAALFRAFAESLASENASRLSSMQVAERNVEDRLRALTSDAHQFRQTTITSELLDIIAAYEALSGRRRC